ncbi:hypothetical protein GALMADRAFT_211700 [Galerina marginata CBS 339.88]|uniref:Tetratricopeptide repeat protein n=1 Tax=Galerina marginata (strain CBS 339.88) TaxID=685588 RepID=A0A067SUV0_GALM3|nr:hypothetical protein GALMADRAFT_211700 [Galerina marginata CBS 339.88]
MDGHRILVGDVLTCYGRILLNLDRYNQAEEQFSLAHQTFLSIPNEQRAARCTLDLVYAYNFLGGIPFEKQARLVELLLLPRAAAVREYERLSQYPGDPMLTLGQILFMQGNYPDALQTSDRILVICKAYGRPIDIARSFEMIGRTWAKMDRALEAQGAYAGRRGIMMLREWQKGNWARRAVGFLFDKRWTRLWFQLSKNGWRCALRKNRLIFRELMVDNVYFISSAELKVTRKYVIPWPYRDYFVHSEPFGGPGSETATVREMTGKFKPIVVQTGLPSPDPKSRVNRQVT